MTFKRFSPDVRVTGTEKDPFDNGREPPGVPLRSQRADEIDWSSEIVPSNATEAEPTIPPVGDEIEMTGALVSTLTVSVAALLSALPIELLTTTVYFPASSTLTLFMRRPRPSGDSK